MNAARQVRRQVTLWLRSPSLRRFFVVGVVGRAMQTLLLWVFTDWLGVYYIVSSLLAVAAVFGLGYLANRYWVFARPDTR
jgi:putative flippase GtrA